MLTKPAIKSRLISHSETKHSFIIEPLLPGYGFTIGNSLRRILLSSIPGFAVTKVKINDLTHEYQPIDGVVEDALDVILNLKLLRAKILTDEDTVTISLTKNTAGEVTAADFTPDSRVKIVTEDLYICTLDKNVELIIELEISRGVGYLSVDEINFVNTNPHEIVLDSLFSPVTNVALNVEQVRVGEKTNFDKIEITFETDRTVDPQEVINFASDLLLETVQNIRSSMLVSDSAEEVEVQEVKAIETSEESDIDLPKKIRGILEKNGINSLAELKNRISEVESFPGINEKTMEKIQEYLNS